MSDAIYLTCPSCGKSFLTLAQSPRALEVCPHCAYSSAQQRFQQVPSMAGAGQPVVENRSATAVSASATVARAASASATPPPLAPAAPGVGATPPPKVSAPPAWPNLPLPPQAPVAAAPAETTAKLFENRPLHLDPQSPLSIFLQSAMREGAGGNAPPPQPGPPPGAGPSSSPSVPLGAPAPQTPAPKPLAPAFVQTTAPPRVFAMPSPPQGGNSAPSPAPSKVAARQNSDTAVSPQAHSGISPFGLAPPPANPAPSVAAPAFPPAPAMIREAPPVSAPPTRESSPSPAEAPQAETPMAAGPGTRAEPPPFEPRKSGAKDFPVWPGLGAMQGAEAKLASASILNPVAASVQGKSRKVAKLHTGLRIPWWVIIVTLLGAAGLLWAFFEKSPVSFSFPTDPGLEKKASTGQLETRRALLKEEAYKPSDEDLRSRALAIAHILERSSNLSNRLAVICAGDSQRGSIEKFFADNSPGWHVDSVQAGPRVVELATLREAQLFRAITSNCSQGALLHLVTNPEGPPLLDWPLFEACEAQGQKGDADATPGWHTLLFRRVEGSGEKPLPSGSEKYEKVHLQTMLKDASGFMAFAKRDSALGTILKNIFGQGQWGLGTFLVAQGQLNGKTVLILKDFRGATSRE